MLRRDRGYLPHVEVKKSTYFVTIRLEGTMPASVLGSWKNERREIEESARKQGRDLTDQEKQQLDYLYNERIEEYLDRGMGDCWLRDPRVAEMVVGAFKFFDSQRYDLHAWCVMPNHAHLLFSPYPLPGKNSSELKGILHSWKSFSAHEANKILERTGQFWQEEYFDRIVRSEKEFAFYITYILDNPVKAGLCRHWKEWSWSGCSEEIREKLKDQ